MIRLVYHDTYSKLEFKNIICSTLLLVNLLRFSVTIWPLFEKIHSEQMYLEYKNDVSLFQIKKDKHFYFHSIILMDH